MFDSLLEAALMGGQLRQMQQSECIVIVYLADFDEQLRCLT